MNEEQVAADILAKGGCSLRVRPGAPKSGITGVLADGSIKIAIAAQAEDGEANRELISFLSQFLKISRDQISIVSGVTSRKKLVKIISDATRSSRAGPRTKEARSRGRR